MRKMRVTITGKDQVIQDMEEAERLIEEAKKILYRIPTEIKIEVEKCGKEAIGLESIDSQDIQ